MLISRLKLCSNCLESLMPEKVSSVLNSVGRSGPWGYCSVWKGRRVASKLDTLLKDDKNLQMSSHQSLKKGL